VSSTPGKLPGMGQAAGQRLGRLSSRFWQGSTHRDALQASSKPLDASEAVIDLRAREGWTWLVGGHGAGWGAASTSPQPSWALNLPRCQLPRAKLHFPVLSPSSPPSASSVCRSWEPNSSLPINLSRTESLGADKATYPNSFLLVSIPAKHFTLAPAASRHQQAKV